MAPGLKRSVGDDQAQDTKRVKRGKTAAVEELDPDQQLITKFFTKQSTEDDGDEKDSSGAPSQASPASNPEPSSGGPSPISPADISDASSELSTPPSSPGEARLGEPAVWADKRQSLCSALPDFKSYQGGLYTGGGFIKGLLIDAEARKRDVIGSDVIMTNVGGGKVDDGTGKRVHIADQGEGRYVKALKANRDKNKPIYVILGKKYPHQPGPKLEKRYSVLGWFHVVEVFQEKYQSNLNTPLVTLWALRLEKVNIEEPSWWAGGETAIDTPVDAPLPVEKCGKCDQDHPQIFTQGWTCLKANCTDFFNFRNAPVELSELEYSPQYLGQRTKFQGVAELPPIMPELPSTEYFPKDEEATYGTEETFRQGMVCHQCGGCSSRRFWTRWQCENADCGYIHKAGIVEYPLRNVVDENKALKKLKSRSKRNSFASQSEDSLELVKHEAIERIEDRKYGAFTAATYLLPDAENKTIGTVTILRSNSTINGKRGGADALWEELEGNEDLDLKRNPVRHPGLASEILTRHFAKNYGVPYKFVVSVMSSAFKDAPPPVLKALIMMTWAGKKVVQEMADIVTQDWDQTVLPNIYQDFNELLHLGYMENDMIDYHDDGERELGPTVATLSLGSPSTMAFSPKEKSGLSKKLKLKGAKTCVLEFSLQHGDILIMHGAKIHSHYLHKVEPHGKRRYALTCRYVDPARMDDPKDRADAVEKGHIPDDVRQRYQYHGGV